MPWNFKRLREEMLVVAVTVVTGDAACVPQGGSGLILHPVLGAREDVAPEELAFSQGFIELGNQKLGGVLSGGWRRRVRASSVRGVVFSHDRLARGAKGGAENDRHGGDQGATRGAAGDEGGKRDSETRAKALTFVAATENTKRAQRTPKRAHQRWRHRNCARGLIFR